MKGLEDKKKKISRKTGQLSVCQKSLTQILTFHNPTGSSQNSDACGLHSSLSFLFLWHFETMQLVIAGISVLQLFRLMFHKTTCRYLWHISGDV